ncbi:hypothetical protein OG259_04900 [Streptomyces sp. NBC_00250]|nr:hypothetical protein [Streptomyces sp. NBC_00250]
MAGVAAVRLPPPASLALLDLILVVTAAVLVRAHRSPARSLEAPSGV